MLLVTVSMHRGTCFCDEICVLMLLQMSDIQVTWSVADERDEVADGRWDDDGMEATRTMLLFSAEKLESVIVKLQTELAT